MASLSRTVANLLRARSSSDRGDVERVLARFGFAHVRTTGSHATWRHPDGRQLTVPSVSGRTVKRVYVRRIAEMLDLQGWLEEQDDEASPDEQREGDAS